jgi:20S proteasome subunit beta 4
MRNDTDLGPSAVANFVRGELAKSLRSKHPYTVNLLLGGLDPITKQPHLYWLDYLASLAPLPYAAHGYAQYVVSSPSALRIFQGLAASIIPAAFTKPYFRYYCLSILDKHHHPEINFEQGMKILRMCTDELQRRLPIDFKGVSLGRSLLVMTELKPSRCW